MKNKNRSKKKFDFDSLFDNKIFLVIISIVCAIFLWYSTYTSFGVEEERVVNDVPITIDTSAIYKRYNLEVIEIISPDELKNRTMNVNIISKTPLLRNCSADDFSVSVDTSMVTQAGTYQLELIINCINPALNVEISNDNQQYITVRFDKVISKKYTISNVVLNGNLTVADGYTMETPYSNVSEITLTGPELVLNKIDSVAVMAQADSTLNSTVIYEGELVFYDSDMNVVSENTISNDFTSTILVTVPIKMTKQLDMAVNFKNLPKGYDGDSLYTITPSKITVKGEEEAIVEAFKNNNYVVDTIDFSTINSSYPSFSFELALANGIEPTEEIETVKVTLKLGNIRSKVFEVSSDNATFNIINGDFAKNAEVITTKLSSVTICGPQGQLKNITGKDIVVSADLTDRQSYKGNCVVPAIISIPKYDKCWAYGTYEIEVKIPE